MSDACGLEAPDDVLRALKRAKQGGADQECEPIYERSEINSRDSGSSPPRLKYYVSPGTTCLCENLEQSMLVTVRISPLFKICHPISPKENPTVRRIFFWGLVNLFPLHYITLYSKLGTAVLI
jgi:hypothetical protein